MNTGAKLTALNKFRNNNPSMMRQQMTKVLVVYDVVVKSGDVPQVPLVINYGVFVLRAAQCCPPLTAFFLDLPKAVEEYAHR